jgi:LmbE family N-acetylglucosaminyl deacetylase
MKALAPTFGDSLSSVLCLGAHSDDIEIGCGGTLLKLLERYPDLAVDWVVLSAVGERAVEARHGSKRFLEGAGKSTVLLNDFRDGYFPYLGGEIKEYFDWLGATRAPDLVFTHYGQDAHQDHRLISELTWNTFRDHLVLEYEIPKYDGDLGRPNVFVPLARAEGERKVDFIIETFRTQADKHWFSEETLWAHMRLRGIECRAPGGYAEAFHGRKMLLT